MDASVFGDACPGTSKYLEIIYTCQAGKQEDHTSSPVAPWLRDLSATPPTTTTKTTTTTTATTTTTTEPAYDFQEFEVIVDDGEDMEDEEIIVDFPEEPVGHCAPINERNLLWDWTESGREAIQPCPPGSSGFATWMCNPDGHWSSQYPNLGECQSHWLRRLESEYEMQTVGDTSSRLAEFTDNAILYGGDLHSIVRLLKRLPERLAQEMPILESQRAREHEASVLQKRVTKVASDLLDQSQMLAWQDLSDHKRSKLVSALFSAVVESNMMSAEVLNREKMMRINNTNVFTDIRVKGARHVEDQYITDQNNDVLMVASARSLAETSVNGAVRLGFFGFSNLEHILPAPLNGHMFLNSMVIGASVPDVAAGAFAPTSRPLIFSLRHNVVTSDEAANPVCAAWDHQTASWDPLGCTLLKTTKTHTTCECHRLTQYAILMDAITSRAAPHNYNPNAEDDFTNIMLGGACLLASLTVLSMTIGLVYAKKKNKLNMCAKPDSTADSFYPPMSASSPSSVTTTTTGLLGDSRLYKSNTDEISRQLQSRPPPNVILNRQASTRNKPFAISNVEQLYNHIYSEIDPAYARYLVNSAAGNCSGAETASETFSNSVASSSRNSPVFHQYTPSNATLVGGEIHHQPQSSLVSARSIRLPQTPQPQSNVATITLQDGGQLVRMRLDDPYTVETIRRQQQQQQQQQHQQCFQV